MKIWQLITILQQHDPEREVIIARDAEGNGYSPISSEAGGTCSWDAENAEVGLEELTEEDIAHGFSEDDVKEGVPAFVIYPRG